jgi:DNA-directed RNA polymerase subunit M/transcription elongation factor TFIIS
MSEDQTFRSIALEILDEYLPNESKLVENKIHAHYGHDRNQYYGYIVKVIENMKSDYVKECVANGLIKIEDIFSLEKDFLCPDKWQKLQDIRMPKSIVTERKLGLYKCKKCGSRETNFSQFQSRSADEGMTTRIECLLCLCVTKF